MRSKGYRSGTRHLFSQGFREHGAPNVSKYMQVYKRGDYVDIIVDPSVHKGMPFKYYHGKTGKIFNVNPRSVTVLIDRPFGPRKLQRKVVARIEHVRPSRCKEEFIVRRQQNDERAREASLKGESVGPQKRRPLGARKDYFIAGKKEDIVELKNEPFYENY